VTKKASATEDITGVFNLELKASSAPQRDAHRLARALVNEEGRSVLVIVSDRDRARALCRALLDADLFDSITHASTEGQALAALSRRHHDIVILEPGMLAAQHLRDAKIVELNGADEHAVELVRNLQA
jgi:PleD family two-component response regulator